MKSKINLSFLFMACLSISIANAQKHITKYDDLPGINKSYKPSYSKNLSEWGRMLYADEINFNIIDSLFKKEEGLAIKEKEGKETPIKRYYILWRNAVLPYVKKDGTIVLPTAEEREQQLHKLYQKIQARGEGLNQMGNWTFAGPKNTKTFWPDKLIDKDDQVNIYCFDVATSNSNILYAGSESGFLNKTTDKGLTWQPSGLQYFSGYGITSIAIDPVNSNIVYVASSDGKIHKTTDGGQSWTPYPHSGTVGTYTEQLKIDYGNPSKLYAPSFDGLYVSTDAGITWIKKISLPVWDVEIKPDNSNIIYALVTANVSGASRYQIYVSTNGGSSFNPDVNFNQNLNAYDQWSGGLLAVTPANPSALYVAMLADPDPLIYTGTYNASGVSSGWTLKATGNTSAFPGSIGQGYYDLVFAVSTTNPNILLFGTTDFAKSTDGGVNWTRVSGYGGGYISNSTIHVDQQYLKFVNGNEAWIATDGGMTYTSDVFTNPANSEVRNNGLIGSEYWGWDQGWNEDFMVGGRYHNGDAAISSDYYGNEAFAIGGSESATGWLFPGKSRYAQFDDWGGVIFPPSMNEPATPLPILPLFPNKDWYRGNIFIHPNYNNIYYTGSSNAVWKSTDGGASFTQLHDFGNRVRFFQISRTNPNIMYVDVDNLGLFRSADGGVNWTSKPSLTTNPNYGWSDWPGKLSFVISLFNENVIYACAQASGTGSVRKIFRSADGGDTWQDWTTAALNDYGTSNLSIQPMTGNKDGIYLFTAASGSAMGGKVFFRSEDMSDWVNYSQNFPSSFRRTIYSLPFYRDGKIRVAGNLGVWESPLYEQNFPVVAINPMVDKNKPFGCARDTFYFDDYSVLNHAGATWTWAFSPAPAYVNDIHVRNPKVVFGNAGKYTVTESITVGSQTYSKTITDMVDLSSNDCGTIDTVPGKAITFAGGQSATIAPFNITTQNFTMSFWVKPDNNQNDWAGLVLTPYPKVGFNVLSTNELRYNWNNDYWWSGSGLFLIPNKWNHVALVIEPTKATIYLNGVGKVTDGTHDAMTLSSFIIGRDGNDGYRDFKGQVDELAFWNRSLSQNEIRENMHLVKNPATDYALIHYYQLNEVNGTVAYDKIGSNHLQMGTATYSTSTAPVGAGVSKRLIVNAAGAYTFGNTGLTITFPSGTVPNGELCVTRLNQNPPNASSTNNGLLFGKYWVVNNYGVNKTFKRLTKMKFDNCGAVTAAEVSNPSSIKLYKRGSFDDQTTDWRNLGSASLVTSISGSSNITFMSPNVTSFSQFALQRTNAILSLQTITLRAEMLINKSIGVTWETIDEESIDHYSIERSTDGVHFTVLGQQKAMNTNAMHKYQYMDAKLVNGILYYRIQVVNKNATPSYSSIVNIAVRQQFSLFEIFPNPLMKGQLLKISVAINEPYQLHIYNTHGAEVYSGKHTGNTQIHLNSIPAGMYFYSAVWASGMKSGKLVIE